MENHIIRGKIMKEGMKKKFGMLAFSVCMLCFLVPAPISRADKLNDMEGKSSALKSELSDINGELLNIGSQIAENENKKEELEAQITKTESQLAIAKKNEEAQYEDMKVRIQYIYENDSMSLLSMILSADDMSDFVNKIDFVQTLSDYDREMLEELETLRNAIETEEKKLKKQQKSYDKVEKELTSKRVQLKKKAAETSTSLSALESQIQAMREEQARAAEKAAEEAAAAEKESVEAVAGNSDNKKDDKKDDKKDNPKKPSSGGRYEYPTGSGKLTPSKGVVYFNGHRETYYSQKVLPGYGLKIPGRHVASDGTIRDKDGYIVVAAHFDDYKRGSIVETSLGTGKVYDTGCAKGTVDIYTDW